MWLYYDVSECSYVLIVVTCSKMCRSTVDNVFMKIQRLKIVFIWIGEKMSWLHWLSIWFLILFLFLNNVFSKVVSVQWMLELLFYQFQILVLLNGPGTVWVYSCVSPHDAGKNYCLSAEKIVIDVLTSNNKKKSPKIQWKNT